MGGLHSQSDHAWNADFLVVKEIASKNNITDNSNYPKKENVFSFLQVMKVLTVQNLTTSHLKEYSRYSSLSMP